MTEMGNKRKAIVNSWAGLFLVFCLAQVVTSVPSNPTGLATPVTMKINIFTQIADVILKMGEKNTSFKS